MKSPKVDEIMIVVLGLTGSGKTTFANLAARGLGDQPELKVGVGLDPCTKDPQSISFKLDGHNIVLIDTPGFDDDGRNDLEIFEGIGRWIDKSGFKGQPLDGVIILHPITSNNDVGYAENKRTKLIEGILGGGAYRRVVIASTMWDGYYEGAFGDGFTKRTQQLWASFIRGGAHITKHDGTQVSAHNIIQHIIGKRREGTGTLLQLELANNKRFAETTAGREFKKRYEEEIEEMEDKLLKHRKKRPLESWRKSKNCEEYWSWWEWESEYHDLERALELRQMQLKKMHGLFVSD
jgi:hypothetical protein